MDEQLERVEAIFTEAIAIEDARQRQAYLDTACADDADLRAQVEALLAADARAGSFLQRSPLEQFAEADMEPMESGDRIDRYTLGEHLGEGGCGVVYRAEQHEPVRRQVAIKLIKPGMASESILRRFRAEQQALAMMEHRHIAHVYDAGTRDDGQPFFVMELVEGVPITDYADRERLDLRDRITLFLDVCSAVQHAHQKGIIHRDLKPSNLLVAEQDGRPIVKVIDFGIAKALQQPLTDETLVTHVQQLVGTPAYMSPEQAASDSRDVDTRTDIYGLGAVLYELLAGSPPFARDELADKDYEGIRRLLRETDPPTPSSRLTQPGAKLETIAPARREQPQRLPRQLRGELDWIVMKCLEKDRAHRYPAAAALARDIERYLADEPIEAGRPSPLHRLRKFVRRHRVPVATAAMLAIALSVGLIGTAAGMVWALQERERAEAAAQSATEAEEEAADRADALAVAEQQARQRAHELQQVAGFQAAMLTDIDVEQMGAQLRADIFAEADAHYARLGLDEAEAAARREQLEQALAGLNFTNPAVQGVQRQVLDRALAAIDRSFSDQPVVQGQLLDTVATTLRVLGRYEDARPPQERAVELLAAELSEGDVRRRDAEAGLAHLLRAQGEYDEALAHFRTVEERAKQYAGDDDRLLLEALHQIGVLLREQGEYEEAEEYLREALAARRRIDGDAYRETLSVINSLAVLLRRRDRTDEAVAYYREILNATDEPNDLTLAAMANLGAVLHSTGELAEAETLLRRAAEGRQQMLGDDRPSTLMARYRLSALLHDRGELEEAARAGRIALEGYRRIEGDADPQTLHMMDHLTDVLAEQGRYAEAADLLRDQLEIERRLHGNDHESTLVALHDLGDAYERLGDAERAREIFEEAVERSTSVRGPGNPRTQHQMYHLGIAMANLDHHAEAADILREAIALHREGLLVEDPSTEATLLANLGLTLLELDTLDAAREAEAVLEECLAIREPLMPDSWLVPNGKSLLGHARLLRVLRDDALPQEERERRFADEIEALLLAGQRGLAEADEGENPTYIPIRRREAADRLVQLYEAWNRPEEADRWREHDD